MKRTTVILALSLITSLPLAAQMNEAHEHAGMKAGHEMEMSCGDMMKMHEGMKQKMQSMDEHLMSLVQEMNSAQGAAKTEKMAAVLTALVEQRHEMHQNMMSMQPAMMQHMMEHMQKGQSEGMSGCPMMKMHEEGSAEPSH